MINTMQFHNKFNKESRLLIGDMSKFETTYAKIVCLDGVLLEYKHNINKSVEKD